VANLHFPKKGNIFPHVNSDIQTVLGRTVKMVLKPLLRVLIKNEMTVGDFSELAREAYVEVAHELFAIPGKKLTAARVAVLTGLSRKEVMRLNNKTEDVSLQKHSSPNRAQRVINGWLGDREFLTTKNSPRVLPMFGESPSFSTLVGKYSGDVTAGAIRDELIRIGAVEIDKNSRIRLINIGFVPSEDEVAKIELMATGASDMLNTAVHNIEYGSSDAKFQRQLCHQAVSEEVMEAFRRKSNEMSADYLQSLNQMLGELIQSEGKKASKSEGKSHRVGFGIYYFDDALPQVKESTTKG